MYKIGLKTVAAVPMVAQTNHHFRVKRRNTSELITVTMAAVPMAAVPMLTLIRVKEL